MAVMGTLCSNSLNVSGAAALLHLNCFSYQPILEVGSIKPPGANCIGEIGHQMACILVVGARGGPDVKGGAEKNAEQLFTRLVDAGYDLTPLLPGAKLRNRVLKPLIECAVSVKQSHHEGNSNATPEAIVSALKAALANLAAFIADRCRFCSWDDVARQTDAVYREVL